MLCQSCRRKKANRPRGLCWKCYYTPGVREKFPSTSKYARRGIGNGLTEAPLPETPTEALPGTEEKIRVLMERAARQEQLFHPLDAQGPAPGALSLMFMMAMGSPTWRCAS